jgi:hypothetical protein
VESYGPSSGAGKLLERRAYRRGDALEKRRKLMLAWEEFVTGKAADNTVVPLHA